MSNPRHSWLSTPHPSKDKCEHCLVFRWVVQSVVPRSVKNDSTWLYAFPKSYKTEKPVWSTFQPGCVVEPKPKAKVRK